MDLEETVLDYDEGGLEETMVRAITSTPTREEEDRVKYHVLELSVIEQVSKVSWVCLENEEEEEFGEKLDELEAAGELTVLDLI